jgi:hypothetical protein
VFEGGFIDPAKIIGLSKLTLDSKGL